MSCPSVVSYASTVRSWAVIALRSGSPATVDAGSGERRLGGVQLPSGRLPPPASGDDSGVQVPGTGRKDDRAQGVDPSGQLGDGAGRALVGGPVTIVLGPDGLEGVASGRRDPAGPLQPHPAGLFGPGGRRGPPSRVGQLAVPPQGLLEPAAGRTGAERFLRGDSSGRGRLLRGARLPVAVLGRRQGPLQLVDVVGSDHLVEPGQLLVRSSGSRPPPLRAPSTAG